jgi:spermidine synthase
VAALAFIGIVAFARIYTITEWLGELPGLAPLMANQFGWMAVAVIACVLPVMVLLGASFPVAARIVVNPDRAGRDLGVLYASNTIGAILGAWTAGFWLLPGLGSQLTIELLATVNTVLAVGLALATGHLRVATAALALALTIASAGVMFRYAPDMYRSMLVGRFPETELVWAAEGIETSVTVVRTPDNGNHHLFLNGQHQASEDSGTVGFHELLAHLPMTIHPAPQDVLIIGLGGGVTAGTIARYGPQRLDVVELSETVVEGARFFGRVNGNVLNYPNLRLKIDDGRNHLLLTDRKYDVVTADVSHPRNAGAGILYSRDYYALARRALKPGGIMAQWLEDRPDRETNEDQRRLMARTFLAEFPHVSMWIQGSLLIGSNEPIDTSVAAIARHWSARGIEPILVPTGLTTPEAVRTMHVLSDAELRAWAGDGLIMSDNNPYVEYFLSLPRESSR